MQLAVSLTSYKNTIHIFKVTYSRYWISFYFCFRKAANSECITLQEMSVFPNLLTLLSFWRYFIRQKYCCLMLWLFQNVEDWQEPRPPHLCVLLVPLGWAMLAPGAQCYPSVPCQVGAFDSKGTLMSYPGPELELHLKSQWFKTTRSGNEIWLSLFLERDFFSPQFPFPDTYLAIPAYNIGEVAKTEQKKGLKPLWIMYQMGTDFHLSNALKNSQFSPWPAFPSCITPP